MNKELLFIGGTLDGQVIGVDEDRGYINAQAVNKLSARIENDPPEILKTIQYRRERLCDQGKKYIDVMFHKDSDKGLIEKLIDGYKAIDSNE